MFVCPPDKCPACGAPNPMTIDGWDGSVHLVEHLCHACRMNWTSGAKYQNTWGWPEDGQLSPSGYYRCDLCHIDECQRKGGVVPVCGYPCLQER